VVEHLRRSQEELRERECAPRISGEQDTLGELGGGVEVNRRVRHAGEVRLRPHELASQGGRGPVTGFRSTDEFREVMDRTFALMSDDAEMGPQLRDADTPQRFEFTDVDLVVNIRPGGDGEPNLAWEWTDDVTWEPKVKMTMSSETANRYFQGKENVAIAIARRRIKAGGDVKAALAIIPITKPLFARYRDMIAADYPHLEV
jgi:hypothetical protein